MGRSGPVLKPVSQFSQPNRFKCVFLICSDRFSLFYAPYCLTLVLFFFSLLLHLCEWLRVIPRLVWKQKVFISVLQHRSSFLYTEVHGKEYKEEVESAAALQ